jgi:hypothetical protein
MAQPTHTGRRRARTCRPAHASTAWLRQLIATLASRDFPASAGRRTVRAAARGGRRRLISPLTLPARPRTPSPGTLGVLALAALGWLLVAPGRTLADGGSGQATAGAATVESDPTPTPGATDAVCGNGIVEAGEECDDGGTCIGGSNAGTACTAESDCAGNGVCLGGARRGTDCGTDSDCPGSVCKRCVPQGGDGCAANCTLESNVVFNVNTTGPIPLGIMPLPGSAGITLYGSTLTVPVPLSGSQTLTIGKPVDGQIPVVIKAASVQFPAVNVEGLACACVRGVAAKTCGGTVFDSTGTPSADCTSDDTACAGKNPCTALYGAGNAAAGVIGCDGLDAVNVSYTQDAGGSAGPPAVAFDGSGGPGSAVLFDTLSIGVAIGACSGSGAMYGPDGRFCTADDPPSSQGPPLTLPFTTAMASAEIDNADGQTGTNLGPFSTGGTPFSCSGLAQGSAAGAVLASAFAEANEPVIGDVVVTAQLAAQFGVPPPPPMCCNPFAGVDVCVPVTCSPVPEGTPTPTPAPEGACYLGSADCSSQSYKLTSQSECCDVARQIYNGPVVVPPNTVAAAVSWCPLGAFDQSAGQCNACAADPCAGLPTPAATPTIPLCCQPGVGMPCPLDIVCPPPAPVSVDVGSAAGAPGATVTFDVTLHTQSAEVAGLQNDIYFDPNTPIVHCTANPDINKNLTAFSIVGTRLRAIVAAGDNVDPIPDGSRLYTCTVDVAANAAPGAYKLVNANVIVSNPMGQQIPATGGSGVISVLGTPTPTPTPEGECFIGPPDCAGQGSPTSQQACCNLARFGAFPGTASWCPAAALDPSTGQCSACAGDPCAGLPTPPPCCDPSLGNPCPLDGVLCPLPTPIPQPTFGGCALACDDRPCLGVCANGQIEEGTCSALTTDRGCACVPDCGPAETPTPGKGGTPTPGTPVSGGVAVEAGAVSGLPGEMVTVNVSLHSGGAAVAAVQNDLDFGNSAAFGPVATVTQCGVNPNIGKNLSGFKISGTQVRAVIVGTNVDPIPDGSVLYTCTIAIASGAAPGTYAATVSNVVAADPTGQQLPASGGSSPLVVLESGPQTFTPTPATTPPSSGPPNVFTGGGPGVNPVAAGSGGGGGGCNVAPPARGNAAMLLLLVPALLVRGRRRHGVARREVMRRSGRASF